MRIDRAIGALGGLILSLSIIGPCMAADPIVVGSVLDETGGLNIYVQSAKEGVRYCF